MATYILASGTIDEEIYDLIASKRAVVDAATEGTTTGEDTRGAEQIVMNFLNTGLAESE